jgi:hypothetical protein
MKTKLYKILKQLSSYQLNRFRKYLESPYLNSNAQLLYWFNNIIQFISKNKSEKIPTKEDLWRQTFPSKNYNDVKFRKLNSDVLMHLGDFLAMERYRKDDLSMQNYLAESIVEDELEEFRSTVIKQGTLSIKRNRNRSAYFYLKKFLFEKNRFNLTSDFELKKGSKYHVLETNLSSADKQLDIFYIAEKLKHYCELHYLQRILNYQDPIEIDNRILKEAETYIVENIIPVAVYYYIFQTYENPENQENYLKLKDYVLNHLHHFPPFEAREIFRSTLNYCILQINRGNLEYQKEMHEMYLKGVQEGILTIQNVFPLTTFRNIILNSLRLGHYKWTEQFIKEYSIYLLEEHRENAVTFNLARTHWYKKEYNKVIQLLQFVEYEDVFYNLNAKILLAVSYYELDEIEVLASHLDSFYAYIKRNKSINARRKKSFITTINYYKRLMRLLPRDTEKIKKLKAEVSQNKGIVNQSWLLEKISELGGKKI